MSALTADLPTAQHVAILLLRKSDLSLACVSKLRELHAPHPTEVDYLALAQAGLIMRSPAGVRMLTPIGKCAADSLALEISRKHQLHVFTYDRSASGGAWFVRCSCGFSTSTGNFHGAMTRLVGAAQQHLKHIERRKMLTLVQPEPEVRL